MTEPTKTPQSTRRAKAAKRAAPPKAAAFLDGLFASDADWQLLVEKARVNRDVAHALYELRPAHGFTQKELAALVGTTQSVIARLEDADYSGHSVSMLSRLAAVLGRRVQVRFLPVTTAEARRLARTREIASPAKTRRASATRSR